MQHVAPRSQEPPPGAAAHPPVTLELPEGASAELAGHTGDALQSLKLSIPMQETEMCKHKHPSPPGFPSCHLNQ